MPADDATIEPDAPIRAVDRVLGLDVALPLAASILVAGMVLWLWSQRLAYPYDLEWMEGGMLAHAWRIARGLPLYVEPGPEFVPYVYPPGYPTLLAALGFVFGLSPALGRAVSIAGTLLATAAAGRIVHRQTGNPLAALVAAATFLGTYPASGAFFDLVRPDGLMMGLLAASIAVALERHRRAPEVAGALLALAFLCKHNVAVFGLPLALGLWLRDGGRPALRFAAAAAAPSLLAVLWLEWRSSGRFLQYLVAVPMSHPRYWDRVWPGMFQEVGNALPVVMLLAAGAGLWLALTSRRTVGVPVATFLPVFVGMACGAVGTYVPPKEPGLANIPAGLAFFAAGAGTVGLALWALRGARPGWRPVSALALGAVALASAAAMRAHDGGYVTVLIPLYWCLAVGFGGLLAWIGGWPGERMRALMVLAATCQLSWQLLRFDRAALVPTAADVALGDRLVAAARSAEGEVLSPFAAWIPVYAGKPPSVHDMGLWDLEAPGGPFEADRQRIRDAVAAHRWGMVLGGNRPFPYGLNEHYRVLEKVVDGGDPALMPKTGLQARPIRILVPVD
ncbi:MAG: hypothetical protein R3F59_01885 [Myxococcota bacterium]